MPPSSETKISPVWAGAACAVLTGLLLYLSFPPVDMFWLGFVALVPLLLILPLASSPLRAALYATVSGLVFYVPALVWLASVTVVGWLLLAAYVSMYFFVFGALIHLCGERRSVKILLFMPFAWVGLEFIRANIITGFPWLLLGHTQYRFQPLLQTASLAGAYGLSFLLVLFNASLAKMLSAFFRRNMEEPDSGGLRRPFAAFAAVSLLLVVSALFGHARIVRLPLNEGPVFGVVQQNMPPSLAPEDVMRIYRMLDRMSVEEVEALPAAERRRLSERLVQHHEEVDMERRREIDTAARLSREIADRQPLLIAWPETTVDIPLNPESIGTLGPREQARRQYALETIRTLAAETNSYVLVGAPAWSTEAGAGDWTVNSAFLFSPEGDITGRYDKMKLVPFGEYTPGRDILPAPLAELLVSFAIAQTTPGEEPVVFSEPLPFAAPICYDNVFSRLLRVFRQRGARVLVNISNEGWYHVRGELEQHLAMAVFRAVETGTTVVRATNTGISCFIDPTGKIYGIVARKENGIRRKMNVEGSLALPVKLTDRIPSYTRFGDWFAGLCLIITAAGALRLIIFTKK